MQGERPPYTSVLVQVCGYVCEGREREGAEAEGEEIKEDKEHVKVLVSACACVTCTFTLLHSGQV